MDKKFSFIFLLALVIACYAASASMASAQERGQGITFPIAELGSCASKEECKTYCSLLHLESLSFLQMTFLGP